jgi:hypothetical protein
MGKVFGNGRFANVTAALALIVALGGTSYAAITLPKNSVGSKQIRKNAVSSSKVKDGSLLGRDFRAGQLPAGPAGPAGIKGDKGDKGDTGAPGPRDIYTVGDGSSAGSNPPLNKDLPAGDYLVQAKTVVYLPATTNDLYHCDIKIGVTSYDIAYGSLEMSPTNHTQETLYNQAVLHLAAPATITLDCSGAAATFGFAIMTALQLGTVR